MIARAGAGVLGGVLLWSVLLARLGWAADADPLPIAGGGHVFSPGPRSLGLIGLHAEPGSITNFDGLVALAYLAGTAVYGAGGRYRMMNDMRVLDGRYVAADGVERLGTFAFI